MNRTASPTVLSGTAADSAIRAVARHLLRNGDPSMWQAIQQRDSQTDGEVILNAVASIEDGDIGYVWGETEASLNEGYGHARASTWWRGSSARAEMTMVGQKEEGGAWANERGWRTFDPRPGAVMQYHGLTLGATPPRACGLNLAASTVHSVVTTNGVSLPPVSSSDGPVSLPPCDCGSSGDSMPQVRGLPSGESDGSITITGEVNHLCGDPPPSGGGGGGGGGVWVTVTECWGYDYYVNGIYQYSVIEGCSSYSYFVPNMT
jgi:hypothetical protein